MMYKKQSTTSSSIDNIFHGSFNYLYRNEQVFEILFLTLIYSHLYFLLLLLNNVDCKILKKTRTSSYLMNIISVMQIDLKLFDVVVKIIVLGVYVLIE